MVTHAPYLVGALAAALMAGPPLLQPHLLAGHDAPIYVTRSVEFDAALRDGILLPRWAPDLGHGYGEPTFLYQPPLFYYLTSLAHAVGFDFLAAENVATLLLLGIAVSAMYLLASDAFGRLGGLVAAVAYAFSEYLLVVLYVRHALADFAAFAFLPIAAWGILGTVTRASRGHLVVGAAGVALVLLSSVSVSIVALPAFGILVGWLALTAAPRRVAAALRGAWALALGVGLAAIFWLPAYLERGLVHFENLTRQWSDFRRHFLSAEQLVIPDWGYGFSEPGAAADGMSFAVGPVHLGLIGAGLLLLPSIWRMSRLAGSLLGFVLLASAVAAFLATSVAEPIWHAVALLQPLQFPWRYLSLVAMTTSLACGGAFVALRRWHWPAGPLLAAVACLLIVAWGIGHARPSGNRAVPVEQYTPALIAARNVKDVAAAEMEPAAMRWFPREPATRPARILQGRGTIVPVTTRSADRAFRVQAAEEVQLSLEIFSFPGWNVLVNGLPATPSADNPEAIMRLVLPPGNHEVRMAFGDTPVRTAAAGVSMIAAVLAVMTIVWPRMGRRLRLRWPTKSAPGTRAGNASDAIRRDARMAEQDRDQTGVGTPRSGDGPGSGADRTEKQGSGRVEDDAIVTGASTSAGPGSDPAHGGMNRSGSGGSGGSGAESGAEEGTSGETMNEMLTGESGSGDRPGG